MFYLFPSYSYTRLVYCINQLKLLFELEQFSVENS